MTDAYGFRYEDRSPPYERRKRRKRRGGDAAAGAAASVVTLDNTTISDAASIGALVGNLGVLGGSGSYTFTLTSNPGGLFSISGSELLVAAALSVGFDPITIQADNGVGDTPSTNFTITVNHAASGFIPTFELLGF